MAISTDLRFASIDELYLDPLNPRLGRGNTGRDTPQERVLELMRDWTLEELALSYLENGGYWTHEAMLVVEEELNGEPKRVVVEGNRRLAALKYLRDAYEGQPISRKWKAISESAEPSPTLFTQVPYILVDSREDVQAFLGFRHVTGIKQWDADEKAGFIARLVDEQGLTYEQVMRKIGSKTPTVRKHYVAYRLLLQIENSVKGFDPGWAENRFAILYMSVDTEGARKYLQVDIMAEPEMARNPVPAEHLTNLANFARWLFGTEDTLPLVTDTRQVSDFGKILESREAIQYLERTSNPNFEVAFRIAGGDEEEIIRFIEDAADNLELALTRAHLYRSSVELQKAVHRLGADALQLLSIFPKVYEDLQEEERQS